MSKAKYSNDFKSEVIAQGLVSEVLQHKKVLYFDNLFDVVDNTTGIVYKAIDNSKWFDYVIESRRNSQLDCAFLLIDSKRRKIQKVRDKISTLIKSGKAVFLTLTFRDDVFEKTTQVTRRRYVSRFLKNTSCDYVANIDFSPDIGREHYHAVVINRVNLKGWKYGFAYAEKIRCRNSDVARVSKYIAKLTAHALKVDATRLIYSRL